MDGKLPVVTSRQAIKALQKAGFFIHHQSGSHVILKSTSDLTKRVVIPFHSHDLKRGVIKDILKKSGLSSEEFKKLL